MALPEASDLFRKFVAGKWSGPHAATARDHPSAKPQPTIPCKRNTWKHILMNKHVAHPLRDYDVHLRPSRSRKLRLQLAVNLSSNGFIFNASRQNHHPVFKTVALDCRSCQVCSLAAALDSNRKRCTCLSSKE